MMAKENQIVDFAQFLRKNHPINYKDLLDTAKRLKTLDYKVLKQAGKYFD